MPWLVIEGFPLERVLTAVLLFAAVLGAVSFAALLGYLWQCVQLHDRSIQKARKDVAQVILP